MCRVNASHPPLFVHRFWRGATDHHLTLIFLGEQSGHLLGHLGVFPGEGCVAPHNPQGKPSRYQTTNSTVQMMAIQSVYGSISATTVPTPAFLS